MCKIKLDAEVGGGEGVGVSVVHDGVVGVDARHAIDST